MPEGTKKVVSLRFHEGFGAMPDGFQRFGPRARIAETKETSVNEMRKTHKRAR